MCKNNVENLSKLSFTYGKLIIWGTNNQRFISLAGWFEAIHHLNWCVTSVIQRFACVPIFLSKNPSFHSKSGWLPLVRCLLTGKADYWSLKLTDRENSKPTRLVRIQVPHSLVSDLAKILDMLNFLMSKLLLFLSFFFNYM